MNIDTIAIIDRCKAEEGFDPTAIYCQVTGRPIGFITVYELTAVIQQILPCDDDDLVSELWTRTMASMRPSPVWTMMRSDSLNKMLKHDPKALLAYLLNRLYDPLEKGMTLDTRLGVLSNHLKVWRAIDSMAFKNDDLDQLLLVLLNIDSRYGLRNYSHPAIISAFNFNLADSDLTALILHLNEWLDALDKKALAMEKRGIQQMKAANSLTKESFATQFLKATPPSKTREAAIAKQKQKDFFSNILDELMPDEEAPIRELANPSLETVKAQAAARSAPKPGVFIPGTPRPRFGRKEA